MTTIQELMSKSPGLITLEELREWEKSPEGVESAAAALRREIDHDAQQAWEHQQFLQGRIERVLPRRHVLASDLLIGDPRSQGKLFKQVQGLIASPGWRGGEDGLLISGGEGSGKSTALVSLGAAHMRTRKSCVYITPADMARYLSREMEHEKFSRAELDDTDLLLIDELHRMDGLPDWLRNELIGVIDYRYREMKPLAAAGTIPPDKMSSMIGMEVIKRFKWRVGSNEASHRA